jgi:hypothetical protein
MVWLAKRAAGSQLPDEVASREVLTVRHVIGLGLAVVLAAALLAGAGWGTWRIGAVLAAGASLSSTSGLQALAALAGTGLLLGILVAAPGVSPLAAGLPGLALLAWSGLRAASAAQASRLIPLHGHLATGLHTLLADGMLALLGMVMIVPLFVPSRWRRRDDRDEFSRPTASSLLE